MDMLSQKQKILVIIGIAIVVIIVGYYYINSTKEIYTKTESTSFVEDEEETKEEKINEEKTILVHITGEVKNTGIVEIKENARINDAIEAAGGVTEDADLSEVNLAYMIEDGQKINIPSVNDKEKEEGKKEIVGDNSGTNVLEEENTKTQKININKASISELTSINGVGEATATKIVEYRTSNGKFKTIEDIKNVSGIGDAKYNAIKDYITV